MLSQPNSLIERPNTHRKSSQRQSASSVTANVSQAPKVATEPTAGSFPSSTPSVNLLPSLITACDSFHSSSTSTVNNGAENTRPSASQGTSRQRTNTSNRPAHRTAGPPVKSLSTQQSNSSMGFARNETRFPSREPIEPTEYSDLHDSNNRVPPMKIPRILASSQINVMLAHLGQPKRRESRPPREEIEKRIESLARELSRDRAAASNNNSPQEGLVKRIDSMTREASRDRAATSNNKTADIQVPTPPPSPPTASPDVPSTANPCALTTSSANTPASTSTRDHTVLEATKARFSDGLSIEMITTPVDPTRIVIWGISSDLTLQELGNHLRPFGVAVHYSFNAGLSEGGDRGASVRYAHHQEALNAIQHLDGKPGLGTTRPLTVQFDTSLAPNLTSTNIITDTVIIRWHSPILKLRLYYKEPKVARQEVEVINRRLFDGRSLKATLRPSQHVIFVEGLSHDSDMKEIVRRHAPDEEPYFLNNFDLDTIMEQMTSLVTEDPNLRHHTVREGTDAVTIIARFHTSEGAEEFLKKVADADLPWRAAARLSIIHARDLLYVMTHDKYLALQPQIEELRGRLLQANLFLHILTPQDHRHYRHIRIAGGRNVKDYKPMIEGVLNGEVVMRNGHPLWDADLELLYGSLVFSNLAVSGVYIWADPKRKRIIVHGADERRAPAIRRIYERFNIFKRRVHSRNFPRWQFSYWDTTGKQILARELGAENIFVDSRSSRILVVGERAGKWLHSVGDRAPKPPVNQPAQEGNARCPVCLDVPVDSVQLRCKHQYCKVCLSRYLVSATQPTAVFPFQCFASNNSCNQPIPLNVIRHLLSHEEMELAMSRSFEYYVNTRPEEYRHCPTSDCPQIYRVGKKSETPESALHCRSCLVKFCVACFIEGGHDGRTCTQHAEYLQTMSKEENKAVEEWVRRLGGRTCPKCNMGLMKDGGCAHVQCSRCKVHICWTCGQAFGEVAEESVYEHMRREHGSIGLFDFAGGDWEDTNDEIPYIVEEPQAVATTARTNSASGSSGGSLNSSQNGTQAESSAQGSRGRPKRKPRHSTRRAPRYRDYGHQEPSEDDDDDFGGGDWDYDYADMNWEAM